MFEYESVALQHGLHFVALSPRLSLGDPEHAQEYGRVSVQLDFQRFAAVEPVFKGEVIAYGLTIPSNAPHPTEAARFVEFLLGAEGQRIMRENHHPLLDPLRVDHLARLPESLRSLCVPE